MTLPPQLDADAEGLESMVVRFPRAPEVARIRRRRVFRALVVLGVVSRVANAASPSSGSSNPRVAAHPRKTRVGTSSTPSERACRIAIDQRRFSAPRAVSS